MINYKLALHNSNNKLNRNPSNRLKFPPINQNQNFTKNKLILNNFSTK